MLTPDNLETDKKSVISFLNTPSFIITSFKPSINFPPLLSIIKNDKTKARRANTEIAMNIEKPNLIINKPPKIGPIIKEILELVSNKPIASAVLLIDRLLLLFYFLANVLLHKPLNMSIRMKQEMSDKP